jgi:ADP-heptose:LPS heptosyltransferase
MPKFLVIRFSSIGDIVLTTAAIRCLKTQVPGAEVHFLSKRSFRAVTEANPYIDRFHYLDEDLNGLIDQLKRESFDQVIDLHKNFRSYRIRRALGRPVLSYRKLSPEKFLLTRFHIDRMPSRHISERCLDALSPLGVKDDGKGLDHFLTSGTDLAADPLPGFTHQGYTALVVGASYFTKKLPLTRLVELVGKIDHPVVVVGGPEDAEVGAGLAAGFPDRVFNGCGRYDLHRSSLLVRDARLVISHDTGLQYIACAFQKPVLAIWGGTSPDLQVEPWYGSAHPDQHLNFRVPGLHCQPCSNYGTKTCPKGHFRCMLDLDLDQLAATANDWFRYGPPAIRRGAGHTG